MKKRLIILILAGLFVIPAYSQNPPLDKNWEVVFLDDFNTLDINRWWVRDHFDRGAEEGECQLYLSQNVYVNNGKLVLETKKEPVPYCCPPQHVGEWGCYKQWKTGNCYQYTSGQIESKTKYKYGYFEIYAKIPGSDGYFPAFWLQDNGIDPVTNECFYNEIDVFEISGCIQDSIYTGHTFRVDCSTADDDPETVVLIPCNYPYTYHWYGVEWDRDKITWYIDRKAVRQEKNNMIGIGIQHPMTVVINTALISENDTKCPVSNNSIFPNYMYLDQANVYRLKCDTRTVVTQIPDFNTFNYAVKKYISLSSTTVIPPNSNISLRAAEYIELTNGFEVPLGAELYLDVNPCEMTKKKIRE